MTWERQDRRTTGRWGSLGGAVGMAVRSDKQGLRLNILIDGESLRRITNNASKPRLAVEWGRDIHHGLFRLVYDDKHGFSVYRGNSEKARWVLQTILPPWFVQQSSRIEVVEEITFPATGVLQGRVPKTLLPPVPSVMAGKIPAVAPPAKWRSAAQGPSTPVAGKPIGPIMGD